MNLDASAFPSFKGFKRASRTALSYPIKKMEQTNSASFEQRVKNKSIYNQQEAS
ncbi:MAG: hypothetical protein U9N57_09745 [Pseudomonadota bacterium]|nr:hypothetical protein [Pseudomonadota bacterium]